MMNFDRSLRLARRAVLGLAVAATAGSAWASYPERAVTLVAPYPAGGAADVLTRLLARKLEEPLGKPVIVDNRPGAGTAIGAAFVANAKPDGYTLLVSSNSTFTLNPAAGAKTAYDPARSFDAIGLVGTLVGQVALFGKLGSGSIEDMGKSLAVAVGATMYGASSEAGSLPRSITASETAGL